MLWNTRFFSLSLCLSSDWALNIHRDSIASYVGHPYLLTYIATASGQSQGRTRYDQMERLLAPVGPAPKKPAEHEAPAKLVPSGPVALTSTHPALLSEVKTEPKK